jgi:hypothetical protein
MFKAGMTKARGLMTKTGWAIFICEGITVLGFCYWNFYHYDVSCFGFRPALARDPENCESVFQAPRTWTKSVHFDPVLGQGFRI